MSDIVPIQILKLLRVTFRTRWKKKLKFNYQIGTDVIEASVGSIEICDIYGNDVSFSIVYIEEARDSSETTQHEFTYYYADPNSFDIDKIVAKIYSLYRREIDVHKYDLPELMREQARKPRITIDDLKNTLVAGENME